MSDYDIRQFNWMLERMAAFASKTIGLGKLIADLEGLLDSLENVDEDWRNSFRRHWGVLEDVYAVALDRKLKELPGPDNTLVGNAIVELRKLIAQKM